MCLSASGGADGAVGTTGVVLQKKKKNTQMERSQRRGDPALKSLCSDGCKRAHMARLHPPLHVREDEMDEGETAVLNVSCMMDALLNQGEKQAHQSQLQCMDFCFFSTNFAIKVRFMTLHPLWTQTCVHRILWILSTSIV